MVVDPRRGGGDGTGIASRGLVFDPGAWLMDLAERVSSDALRTRLTELCDRDPGARVLSWMLGPSGLLVWAHSVALANNPELRQLLRPRSLHRTFGA